MKKRIFVYLLVVSLILLMPIIQNRHQQIDNSSDIKAHTAVIQAVVDGQPLPYIIYMGVLVIAYPLAGIVKLTGFDVRTVYIWFNFIALIGAAFSLFFVTRKLVNKTASWLSVPITMFCSVSILAMFTAGVIFNVINMYVILPWAVYFMVKWITQKKWYYWLISIAMLGLFFVFHASGMYLPFAMASFLGGAILWRILKGQYTSFKPILMLCLPLMAIGVGLSARLLPLLGYLDRLGMDYGAINPSQFVKLNLGFVTAILLCLGIYGYIVSRKLIRISIEAKLFGLLLLCFVLPLAVGMAFNILSASARLALDLGAIMALIIACLLGVLLDTKRGWWIKDAVTYLTIAGVCITLFSWLRAG